MHMYVPLMCTFQVQNMPHGGSQAFQVPPTISSFSSKSIFICIRYVNSAIIAITAAIV
jgi:hypothetical protein